MTLNPHLDIKTIMIVLIATIVLFVIIEILYIKYSAGSVPVPSIPREPQEFGAGAELNYAVLGDSTAVGQGGDYESGIAVSTAQYLAKNRKVIMQNYAISGARVNDVLSKQIPAIKTSPDITLIAVGANDVTHLTSVEEFEGDLKSSIDRLYKINPKMHIILTGSPQMGSVPRLPQPLRYFAKIRTSQINDAVERLAKSQNVTFAHIAKNTGPVFSENPELFARDNFHPNNKGYSIWLPTLYEALERAIRVI